MRECISATITPLICKSRNKASAEEAFLIQAHFHWRYPKNVTSELHPNLLKRKVPTTIQHCLLAGDPRHTNATISKTTLFCSYTKAPLRFAKTVEEIRNVLVAGSNSEFQLLIQFFDPITQQPKWCFDIWNNPKIYL